MDVSGKIPQERLFYINDHPRMKSRKQEENRLKELYREDTCNLWKIQKYRLFYRTVT